MPAQEHKVRRGSRLSAREWNWLVDQASRDVSGPLAFSDGVGSYGRRAIFPDAVRYAVLDGTLKDDAGTTATVLRYDEDTTSWVESSDTLDVILAPDLPSPMFEDTRVQVSYSADEGQWIVISPAVLHYFGKLADSLAPDGSAQVDLYSGSETDLDESVTAYAPPLLPTDTIPGDAWVIVGWWPAERRWYVVAYQCT